MDDSKFSRSSIDLVVRFTTSIPDLTITVSAPSKTSTLSVKRQIREHLPENAKDNRLRLIWAGKVLPDIAALSKAITIPKPPPRTALDESKGKGKAPLRSSPPPQPHPRIYIHCSIGDALTEAELAAEKEAANDADAALSMKTKGKDTADVQTAVEAPKSQTTATPRGFDRLLNAGFSAAEVATLRTQFLAIQAHTHTPDTMPTGDDLRALEDRWLDSDAGAVTGSGGSGGGEGDSVFNSEDGGLEDMLWGNIMGFFWPIAAVCWLLREEGVWTRRRQIAVLSGMLVNLTFGFLRLTN